MKQLPLSKLQSLFAAVSAAQTLYTPADDAAGQAAERERARPDEEHAAQAEPPQRERSIPSARPRICFSRRWKTSSASV